MDLPPPGPNALELAFRRLLLKCEQQARGGGGGGGAAAADGGAAEFGVGSAGGGAARARPGGRAADAFGPGGGGGVLLDWRVDPKFHCYVDVLREQLQALEGAPDAGGGAPGARTPPLPLRPGGGHDGSGRSSSSNVPPPPVPAPSRPPSQDQPPPDVLALYRARVRVISEALRPPDVPAFCVGRASALAGGSATAALLRAHQQQAAATASAAAGATAAGACQAADAGSASAMLQRPAGGLPRRHPLTAAKGAPQPPPPPPPGQQPPPPPQQQQVKLGKEAAARLATQQALQDGLAEELLGMTAELKAGALAMQGALRQRGRLVDEAGDGLDASAAGARAASRRAGEQYRASRATFCQTCLVLACVACVFAGMLVWIKLTSMVGLSGRRRRGWLW